MPRKSLSSAMDRRSERHDILELREEIERLDRSLVFLLAARMEAARSILRAKGREGRPQVAARQEAIVLARARDWAREVGASADAVGSIFRRILEVGPIPGDSSAAGPGDDSPQSVTVLLNVPEVAAANDVSHGGPVPRVLIKPST